MLAEGSRQDHLNDRLPRALTFAGSPVRSGGANATYPAPANYTRPNLSIQMAQWDTTDLNQVFYMAPV